jgi:CRISPR-associated protein Cas1
MIKKTLYFENPAYLSLKNKQLQIKLPEVEKNDSLPDSFKVDSVKTIPVEDIGVMILDNKQITITHGLI